MAKPQKTDLELAREEDERGEPLPLPVTVSSPALTSACRYKLLRDLDVRVLSDIVALAKRPAGTPAWDRYCWMSNENLAHQNGLSVATLRRSIDRLEKGGWVHIVLLTRPWGVARKIYPIFAVIRGPEIPVYPSNRIRSNRNPDQNGLLNSEQTDEDDIDSDQNGLLNSEQTGENDSDSEAIGDLHFDEFGLLRIEQTYQNDMDSGTAVELDYDESGLLKFEIRSAHFCNLVCSKLKFGLLKNEQEMKKNSNTEESEQSKAEQTQKVRVGNADLPGGDLDSESEEEQSSNTGEEKDCAQDNSDKKSQVAAKEKESAPTLTNGEVPPSTNTAPNVKKNQATNTPPPSSAKTNPEQNQKPDPQSAASFETRPQTKKPEATPQTSNTAMTEEDRDDFFDQSPEQQAADIAAGKARLAAMRPAGWVPKPAIVVVEEDEFSNESIDRDAALAEAAVVADEAANPPVDTKPLRKAKTPHGKIDNDADWDVFGDTPPKPEPKLSREEKQEIRQAKATAALRAKDGK